MSRISKEDFIKIIQEERKTSFESPYDFTYKCFEKLNYHNQDVSFFEQNASDIVTNLRNECWNSFIPIEKTFTTEMLKRLIDFNKVSSKTPINAIIEFTEEYPEHIYNLSLSNTQSRRSRAGKEFETIIELTLIGADIHIDSQGSLGKKTFESKGLSKSVDLVLPGVLEYIISKRNTIIITAKTTLRERWQEVPEEMSRTGAREMFLITLDDSISKEVFNALYEFNIIIVTTKHIKKSYYNDNNNIITFERLIEICKQDLSYWDTFKYNDEQKNLIKNNIEKQIKKHKKHPFVVKKYNNILKKL